MSLSSFKFQWWAPKGRRIMQHSELLPFKVIQGHRFGTNQMPVYIFLLVVNSNLDHSLSYTVSEIGLRRLKCPKSTIFPTPLLFRLKFGVFPLEQIRHVGVCRKWKGKANQSWNYFPRIQIMTTIPQRYRRTDGRTDNLVMLRAVKNTVTCFGYIKTKLNVNKPAINCVTTVLVFKKTSSMVLPNTRCCRFDNLIDDQ